MNHENHLSSKTNGGEQKKQSFPVLGMTCAACAVSVESMLKTLPGVKDVSVNFANQTALVTYSKEANPAEMQKTVQSIGYDLVIDTENQEAIREKAQADKHQEIRHRTIWSVALSIPLVIIGMFFMDMPYANWIMMALAAPVVFYFGRIFFINAWKLARYGKSNMDTLVALSTGIAFVFSAFNTIYPEFWHQRGLHAHVYFEAAAVVIAFISLGKLLEEKAKSNTSTAIKKLIGLQPKTVTIIHEGGHQMQIPLEQVKTGDSLLVKPGERIPVDGKISEGSSYVDESTISGEPVPVEKKMGDKVFAGTMNQKGSFRFKVEKVGSETVLGHIIRMVEEAQGSKAPVQKLVDKIAGIFVPVVIGISILTFITWMLIGGENAFTHGLLTAVTVLVIACPCALGLATPTAIMVGIGKGADNNILIKDAESLELGSKVNAIILDKTGTITEGKPSVTNENWIDEEAKTLKRILYSLENNSEHPLAEAVIKHLNVEKIASVNLANFKSISGHGVSAEFEGETYYAGNKKLMDEQSVTMTDKLKQEAGRYQSEAKTLIYFSDSKEIKAIYAISDKIKSSSAAAIEQMQSSGIEVYMLTGDNLNTAEAVAKVTGIRNYRAEVLPSQKAEFIQKLQNEGKVVAMVGDGINDSHALAQADVSIAMGKGSDIAMEVARITLISSDLASIPKALKLSRKTVQAIRQNLFWAFIYNLIGIPLAAGLLYPVNGFLLDPMIAGAAMALSSVSVVTNSLRLKLSKLN